MIFFNLLIYLFIFQNELDKMKVVLCEKGKNEWSGSVSAQSGGLIMDY